MGKAAIGAQTWTAAARELDERLKLCGYEVRVVAKRDNSASTTQVTQHPAPRPSYEDIVASVTENRNLPAGWLQQPPPPSQEPNQPVPSNLFRGENLLVVVMDRNPLRSDAFPRPLVHTPALVTQWAGVAGHQLPT